MGLIIWPFYAENFVLVLAAELLFPRRHGLRHPPHEGRQPGKRNFMANADEGLGSASAPLRP